MFSISRLKLAKQRRGLSSRALAEKAGISPITLSRLEKGTHEPENDTIDRLASALAFPRGFFEKEEGDIQSEEGVSFRSMQKVTLGEKRSAIAASSLSYFVRDWIAERFNLPETQLFDASSESDPEAIAYELRQYWAIGEQPISHMIKLLESKGIRVFSLIEETLNIDAYSCWRNDEPYIFLNSKKSAEHNRFDCAHELGHLLLHKHGKSIQGKEAEQQANKFASAFLMPENDIRAKLPVAPSLITLIKAKKRWGVSVSALAYRLHKLGIFNEWQYRNIAIEIGQRGYRKMEPEPLPREQSVVWPLVLESLWRSKVTKKDIAIALCLPIEEIEKLLFSYSNSSDNHQHRKSPSLRVV